MLDKGIEAYFENPKKIRSVRATEDYCLLVTFDNGERRVYRMEDRLQGVFGILQNIDRFQKVFLDEFGNIAWDIDENVDSTQHWNNRIDICKDAVYMDSEPIK